MVEFIDLNLSTSSLVEQAKELGFASTVGLKVVSITKPAKVQGVCAIEGASEEALVATCKSNKQMLLVNPLLLNNFHKSRALVEIVREKKKCFEIPIASLLNCNYVQRARLFNNLRIFLKLCIKRKVPFIFTSRAKAVFDLKSPQEIIAIGTVLGLSTLQAQYAISAQPHFTQREFK